MTAVGKTDRGQRRRENQDTFYIEVFHADSQALIVVADGMGGANAGDIASDMTVSLFAQEVNKRRKPGMTDAYIRAIMDSGLANANRAVFAKAEEDRACAGMGSTLVAALLDGSDAVIMNVGDSRAYLISEDGILQLTEDHSVIAEMVRRGEMTSEEAQNHPARNYITRAVGTDRTVTASFTKVALAPGDTVLLCTDGLYNMLSDEELFATVRQSESLEEAVQTMIDGANQRGGPDNITVVLCNV